MVRITAELSVNTPTAYSNDRYKYRFGYTGGASHGQVIYKRPTSSPSPSPSPSPMSNMSQKKTETQSSHGYDDKWMEVYSMFCMSNISSRINDINDTISQTNLLVANNRQLREEHEKREKREIDEKCEKERQKEEELKKAKEKEINHKLGKIIYRSRTGDLFEAQHSVQMTVVVVFDKKTGTSTQNSTQKVVWKDKVFETKQDWFSEMARLSAATVDEKIKIVTCE
jgi:hypothetical protein